MKYGLILKRKYLKDLIEWMNNPRRKPLMVWGARQVGKSYLMKQNCTIVKLEVGKTYDSVAKDRFLLCVNAVGFNDAKAGYFGGQQPLYAKEAIHGENKYVTSWSKVD